MLEWSAACSGALASQHGTASPPFFRAEPEAEGEEKRNLARLGKVIIARVDVRVERRKQAEADEADEQADDKLCGRAHRQEDGEADERDLSQTFEDFEPARARGASSTRSSPGPKRSRG